MNWKPLGLGGIKILSRMVSYSRLPLPGMRLRRQKSNTHSKSPPDWHEPLFSVYCVVSGHLIEHNWQWHHWRGQMLRNADIGQQYFNYRRSCSRTGHKIKWFWVPIRCYGFSRWIQWHFSCLSLRSLNLPIFNERWHIYYILLFLPHFQQLLIH